MSIYSLSAVFIITFCFLMNFIIDRSNSNIHYSTNGFAGVFFLLSMLFLIRQNFFSYSESRIILTFKIYNKEDLTLFKIKNSFANRITIILRSGDKYAIDSKIALRITQDNYKSCSNILTENLK
jgi:hypothetical protein